MREFSRLKLLSFLVAFLFFPHLAFAFIPGNFIVEGGYFRAHQGQSQFINIEDLIGDDFHVTKQNDNNFLAGIGYFIPGMQTSRFTLYYGLNAFYLWQTEVKGDVIQEDLFENLSFRYDITNLPIYLSAKAWFDTCYKNLKINLDAGLGVNIISTKNFREEPLDDITIPDNIYHSNSRTEFSATIGAGVVFEHVLGCFPVELNYRFFYLGQGSLKNVNPQVINTLHTGHGYANALILSVVL